MLLPLIRLMAEGHTFFRRFDFEYYFPTGGKKPLFTLTHRSLFGTNRIRVGVSETFLFEQWHDLRIEPF